jgi:hypothetical protein
MTLIRTSSEIDQLSQAFCLAQGEIEIATKDSVNPHFKSTYADLTSVWSACRPALAKHGLGVVQPASYIDNRIVITTRLLHKSGQWLESDISLLPKDGSPQATGSCITYGRRYALAALVGVVADFDDDGNAASPAPKTAKPQAKPHVPKMFSIDNKAQVDWLIQYLTTKNFNTSDFEEIGKFLDKKDLLVELDKLKEKWPA